ncbi:hypothetical protein C8233_14170 [Halomonas sp. SF2003]|nr:hypothetical protein C8233_14170 [Halomonas sp. SF2003]
MSEFSLIPLGQLAEIRMGQSPDSTHVYEGSEQGVPFLQGNAEFGVKHPAAKYSCIQPAKVAEEGSCLISVRAPVGETNIADQFYCIGRGLAAVKFHHYGASLGRELLSFSAKSLDKVSQGTTFAAIGGADLRTLLVADIPDQEAKTLERVLDTLDTQIEKTEALIAKLEKVKEGLLHDLLTRGIHENGQLRPSPEQAPELYKESPLGLIPREWLIKEIQSICKLGRGRVISQGYLDTHPGPFPVYSSQTKNGGVFGRINEYEFEGPHVTWTTDGANAGTVMYRDGKFNCTNVCGTLESLGETIHMPFLAWALDKLTDRYVSRVGNDKLMNNVVAKMQVQIPSKNEQVRCTKSLEPIENTIQYETNSLTKIKAQKAALMDDLLTGRVRVTPLLEQQKEVISA